MSEHDEQLHGRAKRVWAQGHPGTNSKRHTQYISPVYPKFFVKSQGPYVWDLNGKRYVDFVAALGAITLGYNHPKVNEAVRIQLERGPIFSLPSPLEVEVAEQIQRLFPVCEKVRFLKTGNEATLAAVRIARSFIYFNVGPSYADKPYKVWSEGFHGHGDLWTSMAEPKIGITGSFSIQNGLEDATVVSSMHGFVNIQNVLPNPSRDERLPMKDDTDYLYGRGFGIGIFEPIMLRDSEDRKSHVRCAMERLRCNIFDEIVTGGRVPKLCVSNWWGIKPDLMCLGKGLANGFPLSIVGGRADVMDCGEYFISSTFSGDAIALAACKATLAEMEKRSLDDLYYYANRFQNKFNALVNDLGIELKGYGTRAQLNLFECENTMLLCQELCRAGVFMGRVHYYHFGHLENEIEEFVLNVVSDVVSKIRRGEVKMEGERPMGSFVR